MAQDRNSYVKCSIVDEKKVSCIILYNDRQITEIKQFCLIGKERCGKVKDLPSWRTVRNTECLYKLCTVEGKKGYWQWKRTFPRTTVYPRKLGCRNLQYIFWSFICVPDEERCPSTHTGVRWGILNAPGTEALLSKCIISSLHPTSKAEYYKKHAR